MDFDEYQKVAATTAVYPDRMGPVGLMYSALGTAGEAGEVADKVKKLWRDHLTHQQKQKWWKFWSRPKTDHPFLTDEQKDAIGDEIGDVLWYLAEDATQIGRSLNDIAERNAAKLRSRMNHGVLGGSGDNR
jgi:NTP pyrophosphatase (non-canonical NTP hydrolase)